jgi:7-cyano-7-deazaguanine synthase
VKVIVILSGGLDSTVLAAHLSRTDAVECVSFDYGQRHKRELLSAKAVADALGLRWSLVDLSAVKHWLAEGGSALLSGQAVPHGHYEDESMKATVVPMRNAIMLSVAAGVAVARKADALAYGAHAGDHAIYPDCRPAFADAMAEVIRLGDWTSPALLRPFVAMTKADIVELGFKIGAPMHLTWSCYEGGVSPATDATGAPYDDKHGKHCGKCGTCVERREAFAVAAKRLIERGAGLGMRPGVVAAGGLVNVTDPTEYAVSVTDDGWEVSRGNTEQGRAYGIIDGSGGMESGQ